jgi:hypothetical protein
MEQIIEYKTVYIRDDSLEKLDIAVNKLIKDGFQPFGSPCITSKTEAGFIACQAMVRYKGDNKL